MKNSFGNALTVTLFGESHGSTIGCVLDGLAPGLPVDEAFIDAQLERRRPAGRISTGRVEPDPWQIVSGVFRGSTTGTPLTILIPNSDTKSRDYEAMRDLARPGHADYTAEAKFHGFQDFRGGGHFSGRITAALTAAGGIVLPALNRKGIRIFSHIAECAGISDRCFSDPEADELLLRQRTFPVLDEEAGARMRAAVEQAAECGDSVGGEIETAVTGLPAGLGEPWFDTVESVLSHALFSIPAVKGIAFGDAFRMQGARGSEYNDAFRIKDGKVVTGTNHNGGINGGITNGMPVIFRLSVKPTPSIYKEQETVNFRTLEEQTLRIEGRHDPAIVHRAAVVSDSVTALVLYDLLAARYGTDWFTK